ncbi:hypothetical protein FB45DRAFT_1064666 [Roridomyces roridus]|uniref:Cyclin N-terminal domain-containing protein n=1 Tax=Roridomyces roridus TaxID=1738132 RepID=A0AAD7BA22_9AGAR|nr:hypothetical protein FB45DRAFT_1064666 [Roridomyces roridus]
MSSSWSDLSLSSASASSWSAIHPASQADPSTHSPELLALLDIQLSIPVLRTIRRRLHLTQRRRSIRSSPRFRRSKRFTSFVSTVLSRAEIPLATVLVALHYVTRARPQLTIAVSKYALERVFLGALVCAAKYTNDSTLKNVHWGICTGIFGTGDIGRIEREFLEVLDWQLGFTEEELLMHRMGLVRAAWRAEQEMHLTTVFSHASTYPHCRPSTGEAGVPELEPSSPQSSIGSLSPPTPVSVSASALHDKAQHAAEGYDFLHPFFHGHAYLE